MRKTRKNKFRTFVLFVTMCVSSLAWGYQPTEMPDTLTMSVASAREVFVSLPSPALESIKRSTRLDMLDYWDVDSTYHARNGIGGESWIDTLTPRYMKIHVSPVSTYEIKFLPTKKGDVIMTLYTVGDSKSTQGNDGNSFTSTPVGADTDVAFYDTSLSPLDSRLYFTPPALKDFFKIPKGSKTSMREIAEMIPFQTVIYEANADTNDINAVLTVGNFINVEDYNLLKLFIKPEIKLTWKDRFK